MPLARIQRLFYPWEAQLVRAQLAAHDIASIVVDDHARLAWHYTFALGGAGVFVEEGDLSAALHVLDENAENDPGPETCVACGAEQRRGHPGAMWLVPSLAFLAPLPWCIPRRGCPNCGAPVPSTSLIDPPHDLQAAEAALGVGVRRPLGRRALLQRLLWIAVWFTAAALVVYRIW